MDKKENLWGRIGPRLPRCYLRITLLKLPDAVNMHLVDASILGNLLAGWLVVIICNFIIMWKVLKLLLKIAEQYVVLSTLTIAAPLAFSIGGAIGGAAGNLVKGAVGAGTAAAGAAATGLGGLGSILRPGRGRNTSQQSNSQQVHNQQGGSQQPAAQQPGPSQAFRQGAGQADSSQQNTFVQNGGNSSHVSSQSSQRCGGGSRGENSPAACR